MRWVKCEKIIYAINYTETNAICFYCKILTTFVVDICSTGYSICSENIFIVSSVSNANSAFTAAIKNAHQIKMSQIEIDHAVFKLMYIQ